MVLSLRADHNFLEIHPIHHNEVLCFCLLLHYKHGERPRVHFLHRNALHLSYWVRGPCMVLELDCTPELWRPQKVELAL